MFTRGIALSVTFLNLALMPSPGSAQTEVANSPQWLIVTTTELAAACAPLTDLRAQEGYKVQQLVGKRDRTNQDWTSKSIEVQFDVPPDFADAQVEILAFASSNARQFEGA